MQQIPRNILLAEDDKASGHLLKDLLKKNGYTVDWFEDGNEALANYRPNYHSLILTDIEMPGIDGRNLIDRIQSIRAEQLIIVMTVHNQPDTIIPIMKKGIYDYIVKPIQPADFLNRISRAFEYIELQRYKTILEKEKYIRMEEQIQWFKWMEERKKDINRSESKDSFFYNLRTSLTQGAGFGQLITLLDRIIRSAKEENNRYYISSQIMDLVKENLKASRKAIETFIEIDRLTSEQIEMKSYKISDIYLDLQNILKDMNSRYSKTGKIVKLSDSKSSFENHTMLANLPLLSSVWRELLTNALKFSPASAKIIAIAQVEDQRFSVSILNPAVKNSKQIEGVPISYENIIFDPFYRIDHSLYPEFESNDLGLGLCLVKNILSRHKGTIQIQNNKNHAFTSSGIPETLVVSKVELPLYS